MSAPPQSLVEISDLHFAFGELQIFRGLSLKIPRGKMVAILGGSGSGKSTLLKLIGGQLRPKQGVIRVDGRTVTNSIRRSFTHCAARWE
jgi:phospholipid/cholesterol/gamma-HCH transport system ATP-binding protein